MSSEPYLPKAMRFLDFDEVLTGEAVIDAVRAAAGTAYVEELFFANDDLLYLVGQGDGAASGNVVVSMLTQPSMDLTGEYDDGVGDDEVAGIFGQLIGKLLAQAGQKEASVPLIAPASMTSAVVVTHGYVGAKRRDPPKAPNLDDLQCYFAVKDFADKLRVELARRIADPSILLHRPPVHADARQLKRIP